MPITPPTAEHLESLVEIEVANQTVAVDRAIKEQCGLKERIVYVFPLGTRREIIDRVSEIFVNAGWMATEGYAGPAQRDAQGNLDYSGVSDTLILRDYDNREYEWQQKMDALRARRQAEARISPSQAEWVEQVQCLPLAEALEAVRPELRGDLESAARYRYFDCIQVYPGGYWTFFNGGNDRWYTVIDGLILTDLKADHFECILFHRWYTQVYKAENVHPQPAEAQEMYPPEARERRSKDEEIVEAAPAPIDPSDPHFRAWQRGILYRTVQEAMRILGDASAQDLMDTAGPDRGIVALWPGDRWAFFSHTDGCWQAQKGSGEILTDERFEGIEQAMYRDYLDA